MIEEKIDKLLLEVDALLEPADDDPKRTLKYALQMMVLGLRDRVHVTFTLEEGEYADLAHKLTEQIKGVINKEVKVGITRLEDDVAIAFSRKVQNFKITKQEAVDVADRILAVTNEIDNG